MGHELFRWGRMSFLFAVAGGVPILWVFVSARAHPNATWGIVFLLFGMPCFVLELAALVLGAVGLFKDRTNKWAMAGIWISGGMVIGTFSGFFGWLFS